MNRQTSLIFIAASALMSLTSPALASNAKCATYEKAMVKAETKGYEQLDKGKSASSQVRAMERTLKNYIKSECSEPQIYQDKVAGLSAKVTQANTRKKCLGYEKKLDQFDKENFEHLIEQGDLHNANRLLESKYLKEFERLEKAQCDSVDGYRDVANIYIVQLNDNVCREQLLGISNAQQFVEDKLAVSADDQSSAFQRTLDINAAIQQFEMVLYSYKNSGCESDYSQYDQAVRSWRLASEPYRAIEEAIKNSDAEGVKFALESGKVVNLSSSSEPIAYAIKYNKPDMVRLLVQQGLDINKVDENLSGNPHPLDIEISALALSGTEKENMSTALKMKKLLLSLGAEFTRSSGRSVALAAKLGDLDYIQLTEKAGYRSQDYVRCYWGNTFTEADHPVSQTIKHYCAPKLKKAGTGKKWQDIQGFEDSALESTILNQASSAHQSQFGLEFSNAKLTSHWTITRNPLGIILNRKIWGAGFVQNQDGLCYARTLTLTQQYDGSQYGPSQVTLLGGQPVDCN